MGRSYIPKPVTREGGPVSPGHFQKLGKGALIWEKSVVVVVICDLNFLFKVHLLRVHWSKTGDFSLRGFSFSFFR